MKTFIKPFLALEWITVLGATSAAYIKWDFPLAVCIGIVVLAAFLTLLFSRMYEGKEERRIMESSRFLIGGL
ncbi:hypothetical protein [Bacillus sp. Marseille-Q1617]|uniref:hypothetical protein n=1 Tax=Bacillus sp. Marseille-Q1617 TaxID=2736887 RepID=UPI00158B6A12|nr:hypothetical protein [Bacillus sp. Marseille-Q1617]